MATALDPFFYFHPSDIPAAPTMSVSSGTADAAYPASNAVDFSYAKLAAPAKMTGTSGHWNGDFGSAKRVDLVMLWHNFDAGLSVTFEQDTVPISGAGVTLLSKTIVIPAKRADGYTRKAFVDLRTTSGYTTGGYRYWRLKVGTNSVPVGMKILFFSGVRQLTSDFQWGVSDDESHRSIEMVTDGGHPWAYDLAAAPRSLRGSGLLTDSDAELVREWFRACGGRVQPTIIIPEPTGNDAWLVRWAQDRYSTTRQYLNANVSTLTFEEITAGDPEWV